MKFKNLNIYSYLALKYTRFFVVTAKSVKTIFSKTIPQVLKESEYMIEEVCTLFPNKIFEKSLTLIAFSKSVPYLTQ